MIENLPPTGCPSPDSLRQLLLGRLAAPEADAIEKHVDACDACADLIAQFDTDDGLLTILSGNSDIDRQNSQTLADNSSGELLDAPSATGDLGRLGPYRILSEIGRGGMGVVYVAEDTRLRRQVALKVMHARSAKSPHYQIRFEREVDALARLSHPNIVQVFETGRHRELPYLAMEYVAAGSLAEYLQGQPQSPTAAAQLTATLADAVSFAHQSGVVHRDLKPANILLSQQPVEPQSTEIVDASKLLGNSKWRLPKIADFGLARHEEQESMTQTGDLLGTPSYMAPEMTRGGVSSAKESVAVDIYGLGAILYELLTGRAPFRGESVPDTFEQVRHMDPVPVRRLQPRIPRDLETICLKCLQKSPNRRYQSAVDLSGDLKRFLAGHTILARPAGPTERAVKWVRRKPAWAAALGVLLLASVALAGVGVRYERRLRHSVEEAKKNAAEAQLERENAQASYREARTAMAKMLSRATDSKRSSVPGVREMCREQQEDALAFHLQIAERDSHSSPEVRFDAAQARLSAGLLQIQLGRPGVVENLALASELLRGLLEEHPDDVRFRRAYGSCLFQQAVAEPMHRVEFLEQAVREIEALLAVDPQSLDYRNDMARALDSLASEAKTKGNLDEAEKLYRQAIAIREKILQEFPAWRTEQLVLAQTRLNLLLLLQNTGHSFKELEPQAKELETELSELARVEASDPDALASLATFRLNWAYMLINVGKADEALTGLGEVIDALDAFLAREPNWTISRHALYCALGTRAIIHDRRRRPAEAVKDYRRVVELASDSKARKSHRTELAALLLDVHDFAGALNTCEQTAADPLPMESLILLERHLRSCAEIAAATWWGYHPFKKQAILAARTEMEKSRQKIPAAEWNHWRVKLLGTKELKAFLQNPDLRSQLMESK